MEGSLVERGQKAANQGGKKEMSRKLNFFSVIIARVKNAIWKKSFLCNLSQGSLELE